MIRRVLIEEEKRIFLEEKEKIEARDKEDILKRTGYMEWLIYFTKLCNSFSDFKVYEDAYDYVNVVKLHLVYEIIRDYVNKNNIKEFQGKDIYYIKYKDFYFSIVYYRVSNEHICITCTGNESPYFIDFNDIQNDYLVTNKLDNVIDELYQSGLSLDKIKEILYRVINDKLEKENTEKVYKKD